ncbi:MAG: hypothetical protein N3E38_00640 [Candidatus Aenigmarchaeota archaeon]|nr:hypothetical protein [Candidatus Aenigmarchaeota archaeon]
MPTQETDYIKIRKKDILSLLLIVIIFFSGFYLGDYLRNMKRKQNSICTDFCTFAGLEPAFVKDDNCYCYQRQVFYNQQKNKTIEIFQAVNAGIIKNLTTSEGLTQESRGLPTGR